MLLFHLSIKISFYSFILDVPSYQTKWYLQTLDHFNFNTQPLTFYQRYLVNGKMSHWIFRWSRSNHLLDQYYKPGGPLLFYTGNEGDVVMFWNNTGFMFTLAQEFGKSVKKPSFSRLINAFI